MELTSANICSFFRKIPIINDDVVRMCPSDMIGWDNIGTKMGYIGSTGPCRTIIGIVL